MTNRNFRLAALASAAVCTGVVVRSLWPHGAGLHQADGVTEVVIPNEAETEAEPEAHRLLPTVVATAPDQFLPVQTASATSESSDEPLREIVTSNRRAAMADFWNLTEEQARALDIASEAPAEERLEVMMQYAQGKITKTALSAEMQAADERGLRRVHEVLGDERFNEYLSMRGRLEAEEPDMSPVPYGND